MKNEEKIEQVIVMYESLAECMEKIGRLLYLAKKLKEEIKMLEEGETECGN